jgi:hypothetical protein
VRDDDLHRRFQQLEADVLPHTAAGSVGAVRRRGRRRRHAVAAAVLLCLALLGVAVTRGGAWWSARPGLEPVGPATTAPVVVPPSTVMPPTTLPPTTGPPTTDTTAAPAHDPVLRPDGLGVTPFGTAERPALRRLRAELGPPQETGSWNAASPFGTCPGDTRAVRWGRLYVLFTNGPTRYAPQGRWHLFAYQVDAVQRTSIDPLYSGSTPPPAPPPLRGDSPRTAAGIGFGSTLAELRAAYGGRVRTSFGTPGLVHRFSVRFGAAGELSGSLSGDTPAATVTGLAAGAVCGE